MRTETKVIQVQNDPKVINDMNTEAAIWGWSVLNVQITEQKIVKEGDSHGRESTWGDKYITTTEVITEHINYATITYQRDLDDPTTKKLADLERDYNHRENAELTWFLGDNDNTVYKECQEILKKKARDKLFGKIFLGATVVCLIFSRNPLINVLMYVCAIGALFFFGKALFTSEYRKAKENVERLTREAYQKRGKNKTEILNKAKAIHQA